MEAEQQLRAEIATLNENIADMISTMCRYGTQLGWRHEATVRLDTEIIFWEKRLRAKHEELKQLKQASKQSA